MSLQLRAATLTHYEEVARSVGLDPFDMLKRVGLSLRVLAEKDLRIPAAAVGELLELSARQSQVDNFGLRIAQTRRLSVLGTLGLALRDAPNLNEFFRTAIQFMQMHNDAVVMNITEAGGYTCLRTHLLGTQGKGGRQGMELTLGALLQIMKTYLGDKWVPVRVCFTHGPPTDSTLHRQIFGPHIEFNADFDGLICKTQDLNAPTPWADPVMAAYGKRLLETGSPEDAQGCVREVKQLILVLLPSGACSIEQVAGHLRVDRRTVHRQLKQAGVTFVELVRTMRSDLSDTYLRQSQRHLTDIATMLGFSGASAYARWHRKHYGTTVLERRKHLVALGAK